MRILFLSRANLFSAPGGDTVQVEHTAAALRVRGCSVHVGTELEPRLRGFDAVHVFNATRPHESYVQVRHAKRHGAPVIVSPIFCPMTEFERHGRRPPLRWVSRLCPRGTIEQLKLAAKAFKAGALSGSRRALLNGYSRTVEQLLSWADMLLPNSHSEWRRLCDWFPVIADRLHHVVPNAVAERFLAPLESVEPRPDLVDCVLCVARIDGAKGQLDLSRALRPTGLRLVFVGQAGPNSQSYLNTLRRVSAPHTMFLGHVPHADLPSLYRAARVHVLPSWMETTGLSSLEAAAMGCRVVITPNGDTREYFGDLAHYCRAGDVASIMAAVLRAYEQPVAPCLRARVHANFTWRHAADATLRAYGAIGLTP